MDETKRPSSWAVRVLGPWLAGLLTLASIAYALDLYRAAGLELFTEQFLVGMLGISLLVVFIVMPARRKSKRTGMPWYDIIAGAVGFLASAYVAVRYEMIFEELHMRHMDAVVTGVILILLVLEGLRRTAGNILVGVVVFFVAFGLLGHFIPGQLQGRDVAFDRLIVYLAIDSNGLLGLAMIVSTTIVVTFVFFGHLLARSGGAAFFTDVSTALMGRYRGGSAKIAVTASALFGSISGSAVSNVVSTGVITIPLMRQAGYARHSAAAIEAVASTGGQLMPPMMGAAAFLMAEILQIPYRDIVLAALIPAILYYVALFTQIDLQAGRDGIERVPESQIPRLAGVLKYGWFFSIPFIVLVWALFGLNARPETSALYASAVLVIVGPTLGYGGTKMKLKDLIAVLSSTGIAVLEIIMIGAAAGIIMGVLNISALGFALTQTLALLGEGNILLLLVLTGGVCILLGMGMPTVGVYILLAVLVAPSLVEVGISEIAAHLYVLYYGMMSMITPPIAIAAFAAASLAKAGAMSTGFAAVRYGWSAYLVPFLFIISPELLMQGDPADIVITFVSAVAGIWFVSASVIGFFRLPMNPVDRLLFAVAGLMLLLPATAFSRAAWSDAIGVVLGVALVGREFVRSRRGRAQ